MNLRSIFKSISKNSTFHWIFILLLLSSLASSASVPLISIFARNTFSASNSQITLYFTITSAVGIVIALITGRISDTSLSRRILISSSFLWLGIGYLLLSLVNNRITGMFLIGVIFFSTQSITNAQLFALAKDNIETVEKDKTGSSIIGFLRAAYSVGWVLGPTTSGFLLLFSNMQTIFRISAIIFVLAFIIGFSYLPRVSYLKKVNTISHGHLQHSRNLFSIDYLPLLIYSLAIICILSGRVLQVALIPIKIVENLNAQPSELGIVFSITPFFEVPFMPLAGYLADRLGNKRLIIIGMTSTCIYYVGLALSQAIWQIYILQVLNAFCVATVVGVGISYAQQLAYGEAGLATSAYFSAQNGAIIAGSLLATIALQSLSLDAVFIIPALFCIVGILLVLQVDESKSFKLGREVRLSPDR